VSAPLDYSGAQPGTIQLFVERMPARHQSVGTVVALAGGPGQAATPLTSDFVEELRPVLRHRNLIVFDQRGTGRSGLLRCPSLERAGQIAPDIKACAAAIGPRRAFYTSRDSADDVETVRRAIGADKIALFGTSYGSKVALAYAQRYPDRVDRMLLDSVVPPEGEDPFMTDVFHAIPRMLDALCSKGACSRISADPVHDLATLVAAIEKAPLRGYVIGGDGRRRARHLGRIRLLQILVDGDFDLSLRSEFPAAVRAALQGDTAPVMRLAHRDAITGGAPEQPGLFSTAVFLATTCQEGPLPWDPTASFVDRWGAVQSTAASIPDSAFFPFDRATAEASDTLKLCIYWPPTPARPPTPPATLPDVRALLLSGEGDLRTPAENAAKVAAQLPRATQVTVRNVAHAVLANDLSGCAARMVRLFFADQQVGSSCPHLEDLPIKDLLHAVLGITALQAFAPTLVPPASLGEVPPARGVPHRAGQTLSAVELTMYDVATQQLFALGNRGPIGGLRGGRIRADGGLDRYSYVPGVEVSEKPSRSFFRLVDRVRVTGRAAARGVLSFSLPKNRISGHLGGRKIEVPFARQLRGLFKDLDKPAATAGDSRCCHFSG
jgi:pimeloyl-ACP methyl ester carboxylesterase